MELFREEYLTIQDDYLRVDPSREESDNDADVDYSNDDLGENSEVTPLGDAIDDDDINDYKVDPDDDDFDDDDLDVDIDTEEIEEEDEIMDISSQIDPDDEDFDDDDDLSDDDDLDTPIIPDLDDDDDLLNDDDDLLSVDDDDLDDDDLRAQTSTAADFSSRDHGRVTGTMLDHEPGLSGS